MVEPAVVGHVRHGRLLAGIVGLAVVVGGCGGGLVGPAAQRSHVSATQSNDRIQRTGTTVPPLSTTTTAPTTTTTPPTLPAVRQPTVSPAPSTPTIAATQPTALPAPVTVHPVGGVTAVGDSVMLDAAPDLEGDIPGIAVNAAVSRQWAGGEAVVQQLKSTGQLGAVVVIALGTNGPITTADFDTMMGLLSGADRVVFVTVHVDRPWQGQVNAVLTAGVPRYPTAVLADWASLAAAHPEWFYTDGTHLPIGGPGAQALAALIANACA